MPPLATSRDELVKQAEELKSQVGQLAPEEVRLLARKVTEDAITRALVVRFSLGCPVDADDVRRTWVDSAPLGGRVKAGADASGGKVYDVVINKG